MTDNVPYVLFLFMPSGDEIDELELQALSQTAERGMELLKDLHAQLMAADTARAAEKLSREYSRLHTTVLKNIEAAAMLRLRLERRRRARPPRIVPREIEGRTVH